MGKRLLTDQDIEWRSRVLSRDGHKCTVCNSVKSLQAHHVNSYAEYPAMRYDVGNGITLCKTCHAVKHPKISSLILAPRTKRVSTGPRRTFNLSNRHNGILEKLIGKMGLSVTETLHRALEALEEREARRAASLIS